MQLSACLIMVLTIINTELINFTKNKKIGQGENLVTSSSYYRPTERWKKLHVLGLSQSQLPCSFSPGHSHSLHTSHGKKQSM